MLLNKSIIIYNNNNNYNKIFLNSLLSLGINKKNIINYNIKQYKNISHSKLEKNININKYKDSNYKYIVFVSSNIYFISNNSSEWNNLEEYIENTEFNIYYIMLNKYDVNKNFYIIKNNKKNDNYKNYGKIPNQYIINNDIIYNKNKSLLYYVSDFNNLYNINYIISQFSNVIIPIKNPLRNHVKYEIVIARYNEDL